MVAVHYNYEESIEESMRDTMSRKNENGYILIVVLLLLLVLTIIGIAAISTSTIENTLSGNIRLKERNLAKADGAVELSIPVLEIYVRELDATAFQDVVSDPNLAFELRLSSFDPD